MDSADENVGLWRHYLLRYPELIKTFGWGRDAALHHFHGHGWREGKQWYGKQNPPPAPLYVMQTDAPIRLAIACVFKNATFYLKEWIEFHLMVGVERFYLMDHLSSDHPEELLAPYIKSGVVRLQRCNVDFTDDFTAQIQVPFMRRILMECLGKVDWLGLLDVDEFLTPTRPSDFDLRTVLSRHSDKAAVLVNWQNWGSSGVADVQPNDTLMETFVRRSDESEPDNLHVKVIAQPSLIDDVATPWAHAVKPKEGLMACCTDWSATIGAHSTTPVWDELRLTHYCTGTTRYFAKHKAPFYQRYAAHLPQEKKNQICTRATNGYCSKVEDKMAMCKFISHLAPRVLAKKLVVLFVEGGGAGDLSVLGAKRRYGTDLFVVLTGTPNKEEEKKVMDGLERLREGSSHSVNHVIWKDPLAHTQDVLWGILMDRRVKHMDQASYEKVSIRWSRK